MKPYFVNVSNFMTEASFKAAKQEASSGEPFRRGRLQYFFPCPMTAIYECRKAAVRELGGTLTEGPVRKKSLKSCHLKDMGGALMSPNFIVFELLTNANIPTLVASCTLLVSQSLAVPNYHLPLSECPFFPALISKTSSNYRPSYSTAASAFE